jgi:NAD(P)-dependent dehydrogenase (short-subunit alcohol dehydrogenase family)
MPFHPGTLPNLKGKVFIVTGGNSGIGYYTVAHLAEHGAHVYMGVRSPEKGTTAIANIKKMHPSAKINIDLLQMDLIDLTSVVAAAKHFLALETALHGLVNNAGIMATPLEMTKDGHEAQWQTNYLAHWVLTEHLLPLMLRTAQQLPAGSVRIVNLTSSGHLGAPKGGINFSDPSLKDSGGGPWQRYGQSKLANILHSKTLHKTYGPGSPNARNGEGEIWVSSVHPGLVETNLDASVKKSAWATSSVFSVVRMSGLMYSADKGSWSSLFCAASPDMKAEQSGTYQEIHRRFGEPTCQSGPAKDGKLAERLEEWTGELMRKEGWVR